MFEVRRHPHVSILLTLILNTCPREGNVPRHVGVVYWDHKPTPQPSSGRQVAQSLNPLYGSSTVIVSRRVSLSQREFVDWFAATWNTVLYCGCLGFTCGLRDERRRHSWTGSWNARSALVFLWPPVLSRVRALSADSIMFLNNQQLVDHDVQLVLRQLLKDTDTTHRE